MSTINKESIFIGGNENYPVQQNLPTTQTNGYVKMTGGHYRNTYKFEVCDRLKIHPSSKTGYPYIIKISFKKGIKRYLPLKANSYVDNFHNHSLDDKCLELTLKSRLLRVATEYANQISKLVETNAKTREIQSPVPDETEDSRKLYNSDINNIRTVFSRVSAHVSQNAFTRLVKMRARRFSGVMVVNATYSTKSLSMALIFVEARHISLVPPSSQGGDKVPSTVFETYKWDALMSALEIVFANNSKLLCYWHMLNRVEKALSGKVGLGGKCSLSLRKRFVIASLDFAYETIARYIERLERDNRNVEIREYMTVDPFVGRNKFLAMMFAKLSKRALLGIIKLEAIFRSFEGSQQVINLLSKINKFTSEFEGKTGHPSINFKGPEKKTSILADERAGIKAMVRLRAITRAGKPVISKNRCHQKQINQNNKIKASWTVDTPRKMALKYLKLLSTIINMMIAPLLARSTPDCAQIATGTYKQFICVYSENPNAPSTSFLPFTPLNNKTKHKKISDFLIMLTVTAGQQFTFPIISRGNGQPFQNHYF
ncbi:hypothetical protein PHYBLDRAFT_140313 [Phycomyces blakesleeanus NRRL 1555(-)]|uniref:Uncharacterized protein n=1 Tax=Phycomyces blakesleeanus (strain ATCC 8743b / DSM 1359 / FGSC 10004 / NBRC 33097 / NRRL 1555) TaxID=763407 RepID=A0A162UUX4_PHYB8|nr:hypothetical protein PHYBLDRAFT_140313 [Phycomyces blakesleeanus NRRL 1555(-)]OAD78212.1 hypothetical protein PHYBLDRAFT_140313 [Phycomyces blakesleeanus NRRL 1555(-)]|eukprot:XP_018296252.1 hypothetical protein PHYBLDRAFT_140313 [Phycomyces blakesleeanus NRRL 1555(-)]